MGFCTSYLKLAYFVLCFKIINTFLKNNIKELKNDTEILADQALFKLWIKTVKMLLGSIIQEPLGLPKFQCHLWVPRTINKKMHNYVIFQESVDYFEIEHKTCSFAVGVQYPERAHISRNLWPL